MTSLVLRQPEVVDCDDDEGGGDVVPALPIAVQHPLDVGVSVGSLVLPLLPRPEEDGGPSLDDDSDGVGDEMPSTTLSASTSRPSTSPFAPVWHGARALVTPCEPDPVQWRRAAAADAVPPGAGKPAAPLLFGPAGPDAHPSRVPRSDGCPQTDWERGGAGAAALASTLRSLRPISRAHVEAGAGPCAPLASLPPITRHTIRARRGKVFAGLGNGDGLPLNPTDAAALRALGRPTEATVVVLSTPPPAAAASASDDPLAVQARARTEAYVARKARDASSVLGPGWQPLAPVGEEGGGRARGGRSPALSAPVLRHTRLRGRDAAYREGARL
jgi:hypothetical protein